MLRKMSEYKSSLSSLLNLPSLPSGITNGGSGRLAQSAQLGKRKPEQEPYADEEESGPSLGGGGVPQFTTKKRAMATSTSFVSSSSSDEFYCNNDPFLPTCLSIAEMDDDLKEINLVRLAKGQPAITRLPGQVDNGRGLFIPFTDRDQCNVACRQSTLQNFPPLPRDVQNNIIRGYLGGPPASVIAEERNLPTPMFPDLAATEALESKLVSLAQLQPPATKRIYRMLRDNKVAVAGVVDHVVQLLGNNFWGSDHLTFEIVNLIVNDPFLVSQLSRESKSELANWLIIKRQSEIARCLRNGTNCEPLNHFLKDLASKGILQWGERIPLVSPLEISTMAGSHRRQGPQPSAEDYKHFQTLLDGVTDLMQLPSSIATHPQYAPRIDPQVFTDSAAQLCYGNRENPLTSYAEKLLPYYVPSPFLSTDSFSNYEETKNPTAVYNFTLADLNRQKAYADQIAGLTARMNLGDYKTDINGHTYTDDEEADNPKVVSREARLDEIDVSRYFCMQGTKHPDYNLVSNYFPLPVSMGGNASAFNNFYELDEGDQEE